MNCTDTPLEKLRKQREGLIIYAQDKLEAGDWHGLADAAMDLRELDVAIAIRDRDQQLPLGLRTEV